MSKWSGVPETPTRSSYVGDTGEVIHPRTKEPKPKPVRDHTSAWDLTKLASDWLRSKYPEALIIQEFSIGKYGSALLDIAAITHDEIIGVEVKGDKDSPARLPLQGNVYSRSATKLYLLCSADKEDKYNGHRPAGWGQLVVRDGVLREDKKPGMIYNAPLQMIECLWQGELAKIAKAHGLTGPKGAGRHHEVYSHLPLKVLRAAICEALHKRDWSKIVGYRAGRFRYPGA